MAGDSLIRLAMTTSGSLNVGASSGTVKPLVSSRSVLFHAYTLFLFTKSDWQGVILPQSTFAVAVVLAYLGVAPTAFRGVVARLPYMLTWLWLHLLVAHVSNQRRRSSVLEDAVNKPWRPIPSGRISSEEATVVLYAVVLSAVLVSATLLGPRTVAPSLVLNVLLWLYNDFKFPPGKVFPLWRNFLNGLGVASFGWGATMALAPGHLPVPVTWLAVTAAVTFTTIQSQDLRDMKGDAARNRHTLPLTYGEGLTRWSIALFVLFWSFVCPKVCQVPFNSVWHQVPLGIAFSMAVLVTLFRHRNYDEVVWNLWGAWLAAIYALQLFQAFKV